MKKKISVSIDEETIDQLKDYVDKGTFRNKSHLIEFALNKFIKREK